MKIIAKLIDMIQDELDGAEEYAKCALEVKSEHPKLAAKFNELSAVEMQHMRALHGEVTRMIEEYRQKNGEPPADMLAIYRYEHEKHIKQAAQIKAYIDEYNT